MNKSLLRIAFADDDTDDHLLFFNAVKSHYHLPIIDSFLNADDFLNFYRQKRGIIPHIIFLDKNMPGNFNYECVEKIKSSPLLAHIPLVIYSTSGHEKEIEEGLARGASAFITKPVAFEETVQVLSAVIEKLVPLEFQKKITHLYEHSLMIPGPFSDVAVRLHGQG